MHQLTTLQSSFWSMTSHPRALDDCLGISPSFKKRRFAHCYMKYCLMKSQRNSLLTVPTHTLTEPMLQGLTITNLPSGLRNSWNNSPWMNIPSAIPLISPMSFAICLMTFWSFMTLLLSSSMYNWRKLWTSKPTKPSQMIGSTKATASKFKRISSSDSWACHNKPTPPIWWTVIWTNWWSSHGFSSWPLNGKCLYVSSRRTVSAKWLNALVVQRICWWYPA